MQRGRSAARSLVLQLASDILLLDTDALRRDQVDRDAIVIAPKLDDSTAGAVELGALLKPYDLHEITNGEAHSTLRWRSALARSAQLKLSPCTARNRRSNNWS